MSLNLNETVPRDRHVKVDLGFRSYSVQIGSGILSRTDLFEHITYFRYAMVDVVLGTVETQR